MNSADLKRHLAASGMSLPKYFLGLFEEGGLAAIDDFTVKHPDLVFEIAGMPEVVRLREKILSDMGEETYRDEYSAWLARQLKGPATGPPDDDE